MDKKQHKLEWKKRVHPAYQECHELSQRDSMKALLKLGRQTEVLNKWQWVSKANGYRFSIIGPSLATFGSYELFDGDNVERFSTLKEAKEYAQDICNNKSL